MRKYLVNLVFVATLIILTLFLGCKDENNIVESQTEPNYELLFGKWAISTLTLIDGDSTVTFNAKDIHVSITYVLRDDNTATRMQLNQGEMEVTNCEWYATTNQIVLRHKNLEEEYFNYRYEKDILSLQYTFTNPNGQVILVWYSFEKIVQ